MGERNGGGTGKAKRKKMELEKVTCGKLMAYRSRIEEATSSTCEIATKLQRTKLPAGKRGERSSC